MGVARNLRKGKGAARSVYAYLCHPIDTGDIWTRDLRPAADRNHSTEAASDWQDNHPGTAKIEIYASQGSELGDGKRAQARSC